MSAGDWKEMFTAACDGKLDLVDYHVRAGIDVNHVHPEVQSTPLVGAILAGQETVALYLLDHGAEPALLSPFEGLTPLQAARRAGLPVVEQRLLALGVSTAPPRAPGGWIARLLGLGGW